MSSTPMRGEFNIDLNAYYPHLPVRLRNEINEAIVKLMSGGQARTVCKKPVKKKTQHFPPSVQRYSAALPPDTIFRVTGKMPHNRGTKTELFLRTLKSTEYMKQQIEAELRGWLVQQGVTKKEIDGRYSAWMCNFVRGGYLEIIG